MFQRRRHPALPQEDILPLDFDDCCNQMLEFGYEVSPSELHGLL